MPLLMDTTMEELQTSSNYQFSAVRVDELGATDYTLVSLVQDVSGSVSGFELDMESCLKTILESCQRSPRSDNLLLRLLKFNNSLEEVHGFKMLDTVTPADYDNCLSPSGGTALFDATQAAVEATRDYATILNDQDFLVNAVVFVITDGGDNGSSATATTVKAAIDDTMKAECLESLTVVLIGVDDQDVMIRNALQQFQTDADITQFVGLGDATAKRLAKLAQFVSRSISSTSQALGSGAPSTLLNSDSLTI